MVKAVNPGARCVEAPTGATSGGRRMSTSTLQRRKESGVVRGTRHGARLALAVLAAPVLLVSLAQPAHAATGSISEPPAGQTFTNGSTLILRAQVSRGFNDGAKVAMTLQLPGSSTEFEVASHSGGGASGGRFDLQFTYDPSCPSFPGTSCNGRPAPNGTHVIRLRGTSSPVERTFVMRVPPRRPTGVTATTTGQSQITVRWDRGNEPDLAGYDVYSNGDSVIGRDLPPDTTEYVVNYPSSGAEGEKVFSIVAKRRACPGCSDVLESPRSDQASARIDAPPPPPPSQDPNATPPPPSSAPSSSASPGGGSSSGKPAPEPSTSAGGAAASGSPTPNSSGGGSSTGGGAASGAPSSPTGGAGNPPSAPVIAQRQAFALTFRDFQPKLGAPKLPPLPDFTDPEIFEEEGTFEETLDFGDQDVEELVSSAQGGGSRSIVEEFVTQAFEGRKLWSSIGWSLILFLIAGHLRRWLNAVPHP